MGELEFKTEISDFEKDIELIMNGEKGLSYSALSSFLKSPKHFYEYKTNKETTPAMEEGQIFHMACLESEVFKEKYWVLDDSEKVEDLLKNGYLDSKGKLTFPKNPRSTKPYQNWVAEQDIINQGKERLSKQDYDTYMNMSNALNRNSSSKVLMNCLTEKEVSFEIEIDGFKLRGKVDGSGEVADAYAGNDLDLIVGEKFQIDLKKVTDATYKKLRWNITDMNYDLQAGLYSSGRRISTYFLVFIDKMCNITVVKLSRDALDSGYAKLENALSEFTRCAEENKWHASYEFFNGGYILV